MFAGEDFLRVPLPTYQDERTQVTMLLILNAIFWIAVLPVLIKKKTGTHEADTDKEHSKGSTSDVPKSKPSIRSSRDKKKKIPKSEPDQSNPLQQDKEPSTNDFFSMSDCFSVLGLVAVSIGILINKNPHNVFSSRRVFMAPLLTLDECQHVMDMAANAATINYKESLEMDSATMSDAKEKNSIEMMQKPPEGWQKTRHGSYPTTDLNLITDPFTPEDRAFLSERFDARLAPLIERTFGIPARSIRANDLFVVRYDAAEGGGHRTFLKNHTDSSDISFNILLNDAFEGGGTRFWNRNIEQPFAHVQPTRPGTVLMHSATINHEGVTVTKGTRMILVGFLSVDRVDPFNTTVSTGLSWQASWGCWAWLSTKFKQEYGLVSARTAEDEQTGWPANNKYVRGLLSLMTIIFEVVNDAFGTHRVEELVSDKAADFFIHSLDQEYETKKKQSGVSSISGAIWWAGQNIFVDISGRKAKEWETRENKPENFADL